MITITTWQFIATASAGAFLGAAGWHWFMSAVYLRRERRHREMIQRFVEELKQYEKGE